MKHKDTDKIIEEITTLQTEWEGTFTVDGIRMAKEIVENAPEADVVPKSEYDALAEENESLEIELENMRRNLGDAREGWNDAECEVERLRKVLDAYEETSGLKQDELKKKYAEVEG